MKRTTIVTLALACSFLASSRPAGAQGTPAAPPNWFDGAATLQLLGGDDVNSSKFEEYRVVPKGVSMPVFNLAGSRDGNNFALWGENVSQADQRYRGLATGGWCGLRFDYNQIPHNMANNGKSIFTETAPGVWSMSLYERQVLQNANDTRLPAATRTTLFYDDLLAPIFAAANTIDLTSQRNRGTAEFSVGNNLPIDLAVTYLREVRSGYRTDSGGNVRAQVNPSYEVPEPLNDVTQDFGIRAAWNFKAGNVHAALNRNLYDNDAETLIVDNPFQAYDAPFTSTLGGPSNARFINAPDNEATTSNGGFLLKFKGQTRIGGDVSLARWTQNAAFYPYTLNTVILTPTGARADSLSTLPQPSFNGKIDVTTANFTFTSRPAKGLGLRASYRSHDLANKTQRFVITGDTAVSDRAWTVVTPSADAPYGHLTANHYDTKTTRLTGSVSYDIGALTLEGLARGGSITRTSREATSGDEKGYAVTALFRTSDWLNLRATYDDATRTAEGHTLYGFQMDEAERDTTKTGIQVDVMPTDTVGLTFAYFRRDVQYPNRPDRVPVTSGAPTPGGVAFPGTPSGLLEAKYDSYTGEVSFNPSERAELSAYYTYEKDATTNQWSTTTGLNLNNLLNMAGTDTTNTFGANVVLQLVPDKWSATFNAMRQKVDGLMDITAR
ncbi:MAG: MtrB/PioB family outer membrane beta-barrel protein, partial [Acidobacteriota bacterium]|nr:MtrB/PioB family outer membrane beta-barrel protein [Acidobacteriota bacterium]